MMLKEIKKVAVLGAGTMGPGIAQTYAMGGREVRLCDISEAALEKAKVMLRTNVDTFVEEELLTAAEAQQVLGRISFCGTVAEAVAGVQFVQETVAERPAVKKAVFEELDRLLPANVVIVSNASSLNPFELMPKRRQPFFTTAHWFAPPHIIPLVEVARGEATTEETMAVAIELLQTCGKTPVRLEKFVPGYIINRLQILLNTEVFYLLDNGICTPEQLDLAVKASLMPRGMVLGLVQRYDFTGLDISANNIINASYVMPETSKRPQVLFDHVDKGELGAKTGKGFFDYGERSYAELCKKRDKMLFQVLKATKHLINEKI
ncbi:MAG: 3-hydroxyacyl-CoA dehydrogenase family protein [Negativicutes bacterium]|nr:3-hydroxyacyl-CoA dehydrogenase family protein [Negativicutes bacterium]